MSSKYNSLSPSRHLTQETTLSSKTWKESAAQRTKFKEIQEKQTKAKEAELLSTNYGKIIKKHPEYKNPSVFQTLKELPILSLEYKKKGRKLRTNIKITLDKNIYIGELSAEDSNSSNHLRDGLGCLVFKDGSMYEGYFFKGNFFDYGRFVTVEGKVIEGSWNGSLFNGKGIIKTFNPDSFYTGSIENNYSEGQGRQVTQKYEYEGGFHLDKKQGFGNLNFKDGRSYSGYFFQDKQCGRGKFTYTDGSIAEGKWDKNQLNGLGEKTWINGEKYKGNFENGARWGKGKMTWPDGRYYKGYWKSDLFHGKGKLKEPSGNVIKGYWEYNTLIKTISETFEENKWNLNKVADDLPELKIKLNFSKELAKLEIMNFKGFIREFCENYRIVKDFPIKEDEILEEHEVHVFNDYYKEWKHKVKVNPEIDEEISLKLNSALQEVPKITKFERILGVWNKFSIFYHNKSINLFESEDNFENPEPESLQFNQNWEKLKKNYYYIGETNSQGTLFGRGVLISKKKIYEGCFSNGKMQGLGRKITTKYQYIGYFNNNKKFGFGVKLKKDSLYIGEFDNDKQHGIGYYKNLEVHYTGQWANGKYHGNGFLVDADKSCYEGEFFNGEKHGKGKIVYENGNGVQGFWVNGEINQDFVSFKHKIYKVNEETSEYEKREVLTETFFSKFKHSLTMPEKKF